MFFQVCHDLVHSTGYVTGKASEGQYWEAVRRATGIDGNDLELRNEIIKRFTLRPWIFKVVDKIRESGIPVGILSDQTNWLEEIDSSHHFFHHFDYVFNSWHTGESKINPSTFRDILAATGTKPENALFVDDNSGNCDRARQAGIHAIHFTGRETFTAELSAYCPFIAA